MHIRKKTASLALFLPVVTVIWGSSSEFTAPTETHMRTTTNTCKGYFRSLAPDGGSGSINYISAPAIKQGYYQAAARRPGKAWPIKACCDVRAVARSCDGNREWQLMLSRDGEDGESEDGHLRRNSKRKREGKRCVREQQQNICKLPISDTLSSPSL